METLQPQDLHLEGARVRFTPLQIENIYTHFTWNNDPELNHFDSEVPFETETFGSFKRRFEQLIRKPAPTARDFEVHAEDGTLIGVAYVADLSLHNRHASVGVTIGNRDYWGRGYGRESLELLLHYGFNELGLHRVSTETFEYNAAWRVLVERAGFRHEGVLREYLFRDGRYWDNHIYALLEDAYRARDLAADLKDEPDLKFLTPFAEVAGTAEVPTKEPVHG